MSMMISSNKYTLKKLVTRVCVCVCVCDDERYQQKTSKRHPIFFLEHQTKCPSLADGICIYFFFFNFIIAYFELRCVALLWKHIYLYLDKSVNHDKSKLLLLCDWQLRKYKVCWMLDHNFRVLFLSQKIWFELPSLQWATS